MSAVIPKPVLCIRLSTNLTSSRMTMKNAEYTLPAQEYARLWFNWPLVLSLTHSPAVVRGFLISRIKKNKATGIEKLKSKSTQPTEHACYTQYVRSTYSVSVSALYVRHALAPYAVRFIVCRDVDRDTANWDSSGNIPHEYSATFPVPKSSGLHAWAFHYCGTFLRLSSIYCRSSPHRTLGENQSTTAVLYKVFITLQSLPYSNNSGSWCSMCRFAS